MAVKNILLDDDLVARIKDYRFSRRLDTEAEAYRRLLEAGLKAEAEAAQAGEVA